jgi:ATP-dependent DNA helicase RecG
MKEQIQKGRQIYVVYPIIEESKVLDYKNLEDGFELIKKNFPPPDFKLGMVHGRLKPKLKEEQMKQFASGQTKILVATTVIEVGVDVPNASLMVIESAERFGLSQLHQLRGRVGRGAEESFCILMTDYKISGDARTRMETMVRTTDGFEIAETDLRLRGPGDMAGTQQSGVLDFHIADISKDAQLLQYTRGIAEELLQNDPELTKPENEPVLFELNRIKKAKPYWGRIS